MRAPLITWLVFLLVLMSIGACEAPDAQPGDVVSQPSEPPATTSRPDEMTDTHPPTTLPPLDNPDLGTSETQAVPVGEAVDVGEWRIGISSSILDATQQVLSVVDFNVPPAPGNQYLLIELTGIYQGTDFAQPVFAWKLVSPNMEFVPNGPECGIIPNSIYDLVELGNGDEFTAAICFEIPTEEVSQDLFLSLGLYDSDGDEFFFALS